MSALPRSSREPWRLRSAATRALGRCPSGSVRWLRSEPSGNASSAVVALPAAGDIRQARCSQRPGRRTTPRRRGQVTTPPAQLRGRHWRATAMQAPGEPEQHLPTARRAPSRIAVRGVGALSDYAVALALAHKPAHARRPAEPGDQTHGFIVRPRGPRTTGAIRQSGRLLCGRGSGGWWPRPTACC